MGRTSRLSSAGSILVLGALSAAAGCVDNTISVFIQQVAAPTNMGTTCTISNDPTMAFISEGTLDLSLTDSYILRPLIRSEFIARRDGINFRPESNTIEIQGYVIEIHEGSPDGPPIGPPFTIYQTIYIPPGASGAPAYGVTEIQAIPPAITNLIKADVCRIDTRTVTAACPVPNILSHDRRLIVKMYAFGQSTGQVSVQTPEFDFPVNVCCHCLVQFPSDSRVSPIAGGVPGGTGYNSPNCNNGTAAATVATCSPGQDYQLDCRVCSGTNVQACQPPGFNTSQTGLCP